jgi:hypothetical protein
MLDALDRVSEFRALGVEDLDLTRVPPGRLRSLARYAALSKAQAIQRMPDERQIAAFLAFARVYELVAQDNAVDLLHQFIGAKLLRAEHSKYFHVERGVTYYNFTSNQFSGFHGIVIPGTLHDSPYRVSVQSSLPKAHSQPTKSR